MGLDLAPEAPAIELAPAPPADKPAKPSRPPADPARLEAAAKKRAVTRLLKKVADAGDTDEVFNRLAELRGEPRKEPPPVQASEPPTFNAPPPEGWPTEEQTAQALQTVMPLCARAGAALKGSRFDLGEPVEVEVPKVEMRDGKSEVVGHVKMVVDPVATLAYGLAPAFAKATAGAGGGSPYGLAVLTVGLTFGPGALALGFEFIVPRVAAWWAAGSAPKRLEADAK